MSQKEQESIFQNNLGFLSPDSRRRILSQKKKSEGSFSESIHSSDFTVSSSRSGLPTLKWRGKNLHSHMDPIQEASRRLEGVFPHRYSVWVYLGADLLYSLEVVESVKPRTSLILVFLNWDFLFAVLEARPLGFLGKFSQVEVVTLEEGGSLFELFKTSLAPSTLILVNEVLYQSADDLKRLRATIQNHTKMLMSSLFTRYYFDKRWMKNSICNWESSDRAVSLSSLKGRFQNQKAILVGAGVSLSENLPSIQKLARAGYHLVAVDTALPTLLANQLPPSVVIALDGGYPNAGDFAQMPDSHTVLITYPHLYPTVVRNFPGSLVYFFFQRDQEMGMNDLLLHQWARRSGENLGIARTGNVSVVAMEILSVLGFEEVILSGIDFTFPFFQAHLPGGAHHEYYSKSLNRFYNLETAEFEEIYFRMTEEDKFRLQNQEIGVTTLLMEHSLKEFCDRVRQYKDIRCRCLPSNFSRLAEELLPADLQADFSEPLNPADIDRDALKDERLSNLEKGLKPMLSGEDLKIFLEELQETILTARDHIKKTEPTDSSMNSLELNLNELGEVFSVIYQNISMVYSRSSLNQGKILREIGNTLAMMEKTVSNVLRNVSYR